MENKFKKLSKKYPELKWCIDFILINEDFEEKGIDFDEFIKTIPENERELYVWDKFYIIPNWDGIYYKLFNERLSYKEFKIIKCDIPYGMKEFFEIDEQGNPTGYNNWEYIMRLDELGSQIKTDPPITYYFPDHVALVLENLDNPMELCEIFYTGSRNSRTSVDLNAPFYEIRDNKDRMLDIIRCSGEDLDSVNYWELASDRLKNDLDFIRQVKQIVGEEIFACIAEFERVRPEDLLKRGE